LASAVGSANTPLFDDHAVAALVHVAAVSRPRGWTVNRNTESKGCAEPRRPHDQVQVARAKAAHDSRARCVRQNRLTAHRPFAYQRPAIEGQSHRGAVPVSAIESCATGRSEVRGSPIASVVLWRPQVGSSRRAPRRRRDPRGPCLHDSTLRQRSPAGTEWAAPIVRTPSPKWVCRMRPRGSSMTIMRFFGADTLPKWASTSGVGAKRSCRPRDDVGEDLEGGRAGGKFRRDRRSNQG
jgi:hypothetical protein